MNSYMNYSQNGQTMLCFDSGLSMLYTLFDKHFEMSLFCATLLVITAAVFVRTRNG